MQEQGNSALFGKFSKAKYGHPSPSSDGLQGNENEESGVFIVDSNRMSPSSFRDSPMKKCLRSLYSKLEGLKELRVLRQSLSPNDASNKFEILEFYGDSVLSERISAFIMQTRRFMSPHLLTKLRIECTCNANLAKCYDIIQIKNLFNCDHKLESTKRKGDVVEAIIGEMAESLSNPEFTALMANIKETLQELLSFISFQGESMFHNLMNERVHLETFEQITNENHHKNFQHPRLLSTTTPSHSEKQHHSRYPLRNQALTGVRYYCSSYGNPSVCDGITRNDRSFPLTSVSVPENDLNSVQSIYNLAETPTDEETEEKCFHSFQQSPNRVKECEKTEYNGFSPIPLDLKCWEDLVNWSLRES